MQAAQRIAITWLRRQLFRMNANWAVMLWVEIANCFVWNFIVSFLRLGVKENLDVGFECSETNLIDQIHPLKWSLSFAYIAILLFYSLSVGFGGISFEWTALQLSRAFCTEKHHDRKTVYVFRMIIHVGICGAATRYSLQIHRTSRKWISCSSCRSYFAFFLECVCVCVQCLQYAAIVNANCGFHLQMPF